MPRHLRTASALLAATLLACAPPTAPAGDGAPLAVMGTIPLYWGEADAPGEVLAATARPHWARAELERARQLKPLDTLAAAALAPHRDLLLAQPRMLSPAENVALDAWVRRGGRVLLLADPAMTAGSRYPLGDPRRPQDVALMSPILAHWGLTLTVAANQGEGYATRPVGAAAMPVNLPGRLEARRGSTCRLLGGGLVAQCPIDAGMATIVADAAVLDPAAPRATAAAALAWLVNYAFPARL